MFGARLQLHCKWRGVVGLGVVSEHGPVIVGVGFAVLAWRSANRQPVQWSDGPGVNLWIPPTSVEKMEIGKRVLPNLVGVAHTFAVGRAYARAATSKKPTLARPET